jgi:hypothetical protein
VSGILQIYNNNALSSLDGLYNLTTVSGLLDIGDNDALTNLCALYNLTLTGPNLNIYSNTLLSMDTANALKAQLRYNGFTGDAYIADNSGSQQVFCDNDEDTVYDDTDNCPNVSNPLQEDADNDTIGDVCDPDTIYGTISGDVQEGVSISLNFVACGVTIYGATTLTNTEGYYAFGNLLNDNYVIAPQNISYVFNPETRTVAIPQTNIQSYNFTATTIVSCGSIP